MNVHEYQAKALLREYGVTVPAGKLARTPEEGEGAARALGGTVVIKAQVHAGGRGKGGGIRVVQKPEDARRVTGEMLGMTLVSPQTGPAGKLVSKVYVEEGTQIERELYLALLVDRATQKIALVGSSEGGMDIEEVAARSPEKILSVQIDPLLGLCEFQARDLGLDLGLAGPRLASFVKLAVALYRLFREKDCSLVEINPLVLSGERVIPLDCKLGFDDNALFRHPEIAALRDPAEEDPREAEAAEHDLSWVSLEGNIGCLVNGAGLAMATMDIIQLHGAQPANFLDVGGTADAARVAEAFRLILQDKKVKGILVNIFGGIVRCDLVAQGVIEAARKLSLALPVVVRLDGTNAEQARELLANSGLAITPAVSMKDAAERIVAAVTAPGGRSN